MNFPADTAASAVSAAAPAVAPVSSAGSIAQMGFSLVLVIGAIFALAWVLRWVQGARMGSSNSLRLHASLQIGTKEKIVLVQVGDAHLLLGVSAGQVSKLYEFAEPPVLSTAQEMPPLPPFAEKLRELLQRGAKRS